jgi:RNA polymerase sigma factor (sigma-70 family)
MLNSRSDESSERRHSRGDMLFAARVFGKEFSEGHPASNSLRRHAEMSVDDDFIDLIARAKAGDQAAIRLFLSRFGREVQMMVRARLPKRLRNQYDSADFVQAVWQSFFAELPHRAPSFQKAVHLRGYLAGVARNKIFEQHRRLTRTEKYDICREERLYVRRGDRDVPRDVISPGPSPSQAAQADDRLERLIAGRSQREVDVIQLRRLGLTFEEIAAQTGVKERTARRIIDSARAAMEAC